MFSKPECGAGKGERGVEGEKGSHGCKAEYPQTLYYYLMLLLLWKFSKTHNTGGWLSEPPCAYHPALATSPPPCHYFMPLPRSLLNENQTSYHFTHKYFRMYLILEHFSK
jgi:hypothetical protein